MSAPSAISCVMPLIPYPNRDSCFGWGHWWATSWMSGTGRHHAGET